MNYQDKYKTKYLALKNSQIGGSNTEINLDKSVEIYKKVIETTEKLEKTYEQFWTNIYYNDAYVFYKNAIEYYKNIQNSKFHSFFSSMINKKLYTGLCQYIENKWRKDFANDESIKKIDLDDLCNLSVQVINNLDGVFFNCPKIPHNLTIYREELRENTDEIFKLKKGDYYRSLGYMSTSVNPWYLYFKTGLVLKKKNERPIMITLHIPQDSMAYYMNHPFGVYFDELINKNVGQQEYEILMPRGNIFEVVETKTIDDCLFITLLLRHQIISKHYVISTEMEDVPQKIFTKKEYKELDKSKYIELKAKIKDFVKDETKINIYKEYQKINKNKKFVDYDRFLFDKIILVNNTDLLEWLNKKPKYNAKKYDFIPEKEFDEDCKKFMDLVPLMKKTNIAYINVNVNYKQNNELYNNVVDNLQVNKTIKIKKPVVIEMSLSGSIFADTANFITNGKDKNMLATNKIDMTYPMMIIIKYKKPTKYIPLNSDYGFAFGITGIKLKKIERRNITNDIFYYFVEAV
jgi:hypothetical protein